MGRITQSRVVHLVVLFVCFGVFLMLYSRLMGDGPNSYTNKSYDIYSVGGHVFVALIAMAGTFWSLCRLRP